MSFVLQGMAEICDNGYLDALRFLQDNGSSQVDLELLNYLESGLGVIE